MFFKKNKNNDFLSIKIVSQKAEKCNHIPRLFQITSHFSLILFFDMF